MYKFPLILCITLFIASCAISKAELVGEIAPTVKNSDIIMKQIINEERQDFDKKYSKVEVKKEAKSLKDYKKEAPEASIQIKNIKIENN